MVIVNPHELPEVLVLSIEIGMDFVQDLIENVGVHLGKQKIYILLRLGKLVLLRIEKVVVVLTDFLVYTVDFKLIDF